MQGAAGGIKIQALWCQMLIPTILLHCLSTRVPVPHTLIWQGAGDRLRGELSSRVHAVSSWSVLWGPVPTLRVLRAVLACRPCLLGQTCCNSFLSCSEVAILAL